jgi:hypothetical protein
MKSDFTTKDLETIKALGEKTDLTYDGNDDDRLFAEGMINYNVALMSKEQYSKLLQDLESFSIKGKGFEVYGWNDASGFEYWKSRGEDGEYNYIQVTATITAPSEVNDGALKSAVEEAQDHFSKWDNIQNLTNENSHVSGLVSSMRLVESPKDFFERSPDLGHLNAADIENAGFTLIEELFCDSSGFGGSSERALTKYEATARVTELLAEHGPLYVARTGTGQFQVYMSLFKKKSKKK